MKPGVPVARTSTQPQKGVRFWHPLPSAQTSKTPGSVREARPETTHGTLPSAWTAQPGGVARNGKQVRGSEVAWGQEGAGEAVVTGTEVSDRPVLSRPHAVRLSSWGRRGRAASRRWVWREHPPPGQESGLMTGFPPPHTRCPGHSASVTLYSN